MKLHLDTDLGSDTDDACALAMLLGWPEVELTGITTVIDPGGRRAGYVARCLELAGRDEIPVAAGAAVSMTTYTMPGDIPSGPRYWAHAVSPRPSSAGAALDLLDASIEAGATIVAIGPFTNLAQLEILRPGRLATVPVVVMGGWVASPADGLPAWGPEMDWNVQCDTRAAEIVVGAVHHLTLVTLAATVRVHLRGAHTDRLEAAGPLGRLLARQACAYGADQALSALGGQYPALPDDLLNFQHDALAAAVAAGWDGVTAEPLGLVPVKDQGVLRFRIDPSGRPATVVLDADGPRFEQMWLRRVEFASMV